MIILRILLAVVGLGVIVAAIIGFLTEFTGSLGLFSGIFGAAIVFFVFGRESISDFFGITNSLLDGIALGAMVGGGILCSMDFERVGAALITAGWIAVGMIMLQVIPIPFIANIIEVASLPFTVACIPLLLVILFFI